MLKNDRLRASWRTERRMLLTFTRNAIRKWEEMSETVTTTKLTRALRLIFIFFKFRAHRTVTE